MSGANFFSTKELLILAELRAHLDLRAEKLTRTERNHLPSNESWQSTLEQNDQSAWESYAKNMRQAAGSFQIDDKICQTFQTSLLHLTTPIQSKLAQDNFIQIFDEAPEDLVFPEAAAQDYLHELDALKERLQSLETENAELKLDLAKSLAAIDAEKAKVKLLNEKGAGWQFNILSNIKFETGDVSIGDGGLVDSIIELLKIKEVRDFAIDGACKTFAAGKRYASRLAGWANHHAVEGIERGARERVEDFRNAEEILALPAPENIATEEFTPENFDYVDVYNRLLRGEAVPDAWAPFVIKLDFYYPKVFPEKHHLAKQDAVKISKFDGNLLGLRHFANLKNLKELDLGGMPLLSLVGLQRCKKLEIIYADNTDISDLTPILWLDELKRLKINGTKVDDEELKTFILGRPGVIVDGP